MTDTLSCKFVKNNNVSLTFTVRDSSGVVVNITGYTIKWQMRQSKYSAVSLTKTTVSGITIPSGTDGRFIVAIDDSDTISITPGTYIHEAVLTDGSGNVVTLVNNDDDITFGNITLREQYTAQ